MDIRRDHKGSSVGAVKAYDYYLERKYNGFNITLAKIAVDFRLGRATLSRIAAIHRQSPEIYTKIGSYNMSVARAYNHSCSEASRFNPISTNLMGVEEPVITKLSDEFDAELFLETMRQEKEEKLNAITAKIAEVVALYRKLNKQKDKLKEIKI